MNHDAFERIEKKLEPDEALVKKVLDRAGSGEIAKDEADSEQAFAPDFTPGGGAVRSRWGAVVTAAAALAVIVGAAVYLSSKSAPAPAEEPSSSETVATTATETEELQEPDVTEAPEDSSVSETTTTGVNIIFPPIETESSEGETVVEDVHSEPDLWCPDPEPEDYYIWEPETEYDENGEPYQKAIAMARPTDEYISFELDGVSWRFACGDYNEIYTELDPGFDSFRCLPNGSYIDDDYVAQVDIPSFLGDIRPVQAAEVYCLKFTDPDLLRAVRFKDFNNDERYYLFTSDKTYPTFSELVEALDLSRCAFRGQAIIRGNGIALIDDSSELTERLLALDGPVCGQPDYSEAQRQVYLDAPAYGGSLSFTLDPAGTVTVKYFGTEVTYEVGQESADLISYIDGNSHG